MRTKLLVFGLTVVAFVACSKDGSNSKPSIELVSISSNVVPVNGSLQINLEYSDKEGDVSDSLFVKKIRLNQKTAPLTLRDSFRLVIPSFTPRSKGVLQLDLDYQNYLISAANPGNPPEPDTVIFKFNLRDKAKNISDTLVTEPIIIIR